MPRYFFDTVESGIRHADSRGLDLPDLTAVRRAVLATLPDLARNGCTMDSVSEAVTVLVRKEDGDDVYAACITLSLECLSAEDPAVRLVAAEGFEPPTKGL